MSRNISNNILTEIEHNIRRGFRSDINSQLDEIISLIDQVKDKTGLDIMFDNSIANHYKLILNGKEYEFNLYRDLKNALLLILEV